MQEQFKLRISREVSVKMLARAAGLTGAEGSLPRFKFIHMTVSWCLQLWIEICGFPHESFSQGFLISSGVPHYKNPKVQEPVEAVLFISLRTHIAS